MSIATQSSVEKKSKKITLGITGMTCATCALTNEEELANLPGVKKAAVNFNLEKAHIEYDPSKVGLKDFIKTIEDVGYGVVSKKVTIAIGNMSCASCAQTIEEALNEVNGVTSAVVNFATEKATVEYLPAVTNLDLLKKAIIDAGYEVYIIGGYVRDTLMKLESHDIDLFTNATGEQILKLFPQGKVLGGVHKLV